MSNFFAVYKNLKIDIDTYIDRYLWYLQLTIYIFFFYKFVFKNSASFSPNFLLRIFENFWF